MAAQLPGRIATGGPSWLTGVLLLGVMVTVDVGLGRQINGAYAGAAVLTAINATTRHTSGVAAAALVMSRMARCPPATGCCSSRTG